MVAGDEDAFRELYRRYGGIAYGLAVKILRQQNLAEEVVQEVFVSVWKRADTFESDRGNLRAWLLTQVHHRAVDLIRKEEAARKRDRHLVPEEVSPSHADQIVEDAWTAQQRVRVRSALENLPLEQREVLELAYFGGLTQRQIALDTGMPLGTVKSRTMVALKSLRSIMDSRKEDS